MAAQARRSGPTGGTSHRGSSITGSSGGGSGRTSWSPYCSSSTSASTSSQQWWEIAGWTVTVVAGLLVLLSFHIVPVNVVHTLPHEGRSLLMRTSRSLPEVREEEDPLGSLFSPHNATVTGQLSSTLPLRRQQLLPLQLGEGREGAVEAHHQEGSSRTLLQRRKRLQALFGNAMVQDGGDEEEAEGGGEKKLIQIIEAEEQRAVAAAMAAGGSLGGEGSREDGSRGKRGGYGTAVGGSSRRSSDSSSSSSYGTTRVGERAGRKGRRRRSKRRMEGGGSAVQDEEGGGALAREAEKNPLARDEEQSSLAREEERSRLTDAFVDGDKSGSSSSSGGKVRKGQGKAVAVMSASEREDMVRLMRDQMIMARAYVAIALQSGDSRLAKELKTRSKDIAKSLSDTGSESSLGPKAVERMRAMGMALAKARDKHYDCTGLVKRLRAMVHAVEDQSRALKQQSLFLSQLATRTLPKGLFCLAMRLTLAFVNDLTPDEQQRREVSGLPEREIALEDPQLFHYALFSDNVLATAVVVNSTVFNADKSSDHVFHIVTDRLNYAAMKAWFTQNPPRDAALEVRSIDEFTWLNSTYCPVLKQLESAAMKAYYFSMDEQQKQQQQQQQQGRQKQLEVAKSNLKYRNPKYLSMLNHLRFYLPEIFPKLTKILFLDDDIVVQKDLTPLWQVDLQGKVNGAVETCGTSFHRFDKYLNFSHPLIARNFDPDACGWAYGMNVFDLVEWRKHDITAVYHRWQALNVDRTLWKLGTLPPGLITFYNLTFALDRRWHVLGLGYNPNVDMEEVEDAAVVHYNGNAKPWLEIAMPQFKSHWSKYVMRDHLFIQQCNINVA